MLILALFAVIAGAGTALSPCALPILPALLSASATGGRRRPIGVVVGLATTFTITIVGVAELVGGVGLGDGVLRDVAIAALLVFGIAVAVPAIGDRLEVPLSRLARFGPRSGGEGFWSGTVVGAALGFVYAPCAGPILAAVIAVSAASGRTVVVAIAYTLGTSSVLLALALGGRRILDRLRAAGRGPTLQRVLGAVMILTAVAMLARADIRFQSALARRLDGGGIAGFLANPTGGLEKSAAVERRLADLRGRAKFAPRAASAAALPRLGRAPDFTATQRWFNTPGGAPLTMAALHGRVVLIDFWTYTCINCIRTLPYLKAWDARYRAEGLTIVGVHTPEFAFEKDAGNVAQAIRSDGIRYPVVQDNDYGTWNAFGNQYWPAEYLVDARGQVRRAHFGEGEYDQSEAAIRALLAERGDRRLGAHAHPRGAVVPSAQATPETYLGTARAERWLPAAPRAGTHTYQPYPAPAESHFTYGGTWRIGAERAMAVRAATIGATVVAHDVHLVLGPPSGRPGRVDVLVDGRRQRTVTVRRQKLYTLASFARAGRHRLVLRFSPGTSGFAFTFG